MRPRWDKVPNSVAEPEPAYFGRSRCEGPAPGSTLDKTEDILVDTVLFSLGPTSVLDPDPYWIRIQELAGSGSGSRHENIG